MGVKEAKGKKVSKKSAKSDSTVDIAKVRPYHITALKIILVIYIHLGYWKESQSREEERSLRMSG